MSTQLIDTLTTTGIDSYGEALTYFPPRTAYALNPKITICIVIRRAVERSIFQSLRASTASPTMAGWTTPARSNRPARAPSSSTSISSRRILDLSGREVEQRYINIVQGGEERR